MIELAEAPTSLAITTQHIQDAIKSHEFHLFRGTRHMVCCVVMHCGFAVVGESACADPEKFDLELGQHYALEDAHNKVGMLLAYEQSCKLAHGGQYDH